MGQKSIAVGAVIFALLIMVFHKEILNFTLKNNNQSIAQLGQYSGSIKFKPVEKLRFFYVSDEQKFSNKDTVITDKDSRAEIQFITGDIIEVEEQSLFVIEVPKSGEKSILQITFLRGSYRHIKKTNKLIVEAKQDVRNLSSTFDMGDTSVKESPSVETTAVVDFAKVQIPSISQAEYKYEVWQNQSLPSESQNADYSPVREASIDWKPTSTNYELEVSGDEEFNKIIYKNQVPRTTHSLNFLNTGDYFVRVRGVNDSGVTDWSVSKVSIKNIAYKRAIASKKYKKAVASETVENVSPIEVETVAEIQKESKPDVIEEIKLEEPMLPKIKKKRWFINLGSGPKNHSFNQSSSAPFSGSYTSSTFANLSLGGGFYFNKRHSVQAFYGQSQQKITASPGVTSNLDKITTLDYGIFGNSKMKLYKKKLNFRYGYKVFEKPFLKSANNITANIMNSQIANVSLDLNYHFWSKKKIDWFLGVDYDIPVSSKTDVGTYKVSGFRYAPYLGLEYRMTESLRFLSYLKYTAGSYDYTYTDETSTQTTGTNENTDTSFFLVLNYDFFTSQ